jgi:hypothetical protein
MQKVTDLTPPLISAWFRYQAEKFNDVANFVDSTFVSSNQLVGPVTLPLPQAEPFDRDTLRAAIKEKNSRVPDLAKRFQLPLHVIREAVKDPDNGIVVGLRGWLKLRE